uniref:Cytochrome b5 n=1 Tax=Cacopsylla melanoneura TaxID=428564 RepID=A0A8D8TT14_9HEMI
MVETRDETKYFTRKEVKDNSNKDNVVIIYDNSVYNVTNYLNEHPGGEEVLLEQNGGDATEVFNDVGHSSDAREIMKKFKVGELVESERKDQTKTTESSSEPGSFKIEDFKDWKYLLPTALTVLAVAYYMYYRLKSSNSTTN